MCVFDTGINECGSNPCMNGATCKEAVNIYTCVCAKPYSGVNCDKMQRPIVVFGFAAVGVILVVIIT